MRSLIHTPAEGSRRPGLAAVGLLLVAWFGLHYDHFLSADNLTTIALSSAFVLIGSIGTMALLVSGHVDLSIGAQYALGSVMAALVATSTGSFALAAGSALVLGAVLGGINGVLVLVLDVSPLIVTLGTLGIYGGLAYAANNGQTVVGLPDRFAEFGRWEVLGLPLTVVLAVVAFAIGALVITATVTGLRLYATGSNRQATALVGIRVPRLVVGTFAANGALVGLVALLSTAQLSSGSPQVGVNYELNVLAAVILGGVAFSGGRGNPVGVLIAVLVIGVLDAGLIFSGLDAWWQQVAQGALLLVALAADQAVVLRRERRIRLGHVVASSGQARTLPPRVPMPSPSPEGGGMALRLDRVTVRYAGVQAISDVSLEILTGQVVCLVGDNGAGKSTLAKAIAGAVRPAEGRVTLGDHELGTDPGAARRAGVETVYQELALCPNLNVADNLVLGQEPRTRVLGLAMRDVRAGEVQTRQRLDELGIELRDFARPVRFLSGGERQLVQILRVMRPDVRLVLMDEPTSALGLNQAAEVRALVRTIAAAGVPVLLITHDVEEVFEVADRVLVLQRGELVFDGEIGEVTRIELLRMMSGKTRVQAAQILDAVGSERKRIERDLHDGAQQGLVTSALMLNMATEKLRRREGDDDAVVGLLRTCSETLQSALTEMRAFSRGLQAGVLEREGLVGALKVLADRAPVLVELQTPELPRLRDDVERAAYFVAAESLTNALKHAQASRITISLRLADGLLGIEVADDGVGFDVPSEGSGLQGLHDRVVPVGGVLEVASSLGAGTRVTASIPARVRPVVTDDGDPTVDGVPTPL